MTNRKLKESLVKLLIRTTSARARRYVKRHVLPPGISAWIQHGLGANQQLARTAEKYVARLWGGFSRQAIIDLQMIRDNPESPGREISAAARGLATWHVAQNEWTAAHHNVVIARLANRSIQFSVSHLLLEADTLVWLGRPEQARGMLEKVLTRRRHDPHLRLALANTYARPGSSEDQPSDVKRLELLNYLLDGSVAPILFRDDQKPLTIRNITCRPPASDIPLDQQPRVSVLVPAHNSAATIGMVLECLLAQTWRNIEVIVVDDLSSDETLSIAREFAARDPRIITLQQSENLGAYAARNRALRAASGEFVTVHDADDWSHPQKIELQVRNLLDNPSLLANQSHWVRCYEHLFFRGMARPGGQWVLANVSSLMYRRALLVELGGWDEVRIASDNELLRRVAYLQHAEAIGHVLPGVPLSFSLERASSLTREGATHVHTVFHGVRRSYHDAAKYWLSLQKSPFPALPAPDQPRAFPAPATMRARREIMELDLIFIMDANQQGGAFVSSWNYVQAASAQNMRVGLIQWRRYDLGVNTELPPIVADALQAEQIYLVSPGENVRAKVVLVGYPVILRTPIDLPPRIEAKHFAIITNQMSARLYSGGDVQYDPLEINDNVQSLFGYKPTWIPISDLVRDLMLKDGRYGSVFADTWNPLIDAKLWAKAPVEWRGRKRKDPVVGRHGRDHYTKWPTSADAIRAAYCAGRPCEVRIMGGAKCALDILDELPQNWKVEEYGAMDARSFLKTLDFFVHYPHEDYIEEFGRAVMEAMAAGVPVVLPPVFKLTFGAAALYAEPHQVWTTILALWNDEQAWLERVRIGREFVTQRDWSSFRSRYEALLLSPELRT